MLSTHIVLAVIGVSAFLFNVASIYSYLLLIYAVCTLLVLGLQLVLRASDIRSNTISKQTSIIFFSHHAAICALALVPLLLETQLDPYIFGAGILGMMGMTLYPIFKKGVWSLAIVLIVQLLPIPSIIAFYITSNTYINTIIPVLS